MIRGRHIFSRSAAAKALGVTLPASHETLRSDSNPNLEAFLPRIFP